MARGLDRYHEAIARLALTSVGGGQYTFEGNLDLDVIDVAGVDSDELIGALIDPDRPGTGLTDLELNVVAHTWAPTPPPRWKGRRRRNRRDHGSPRSLGAAAGGGHKKGHHRRLRASSEKRASDLYDLGRLLVDGGLRRSELTEQPPVLAQAVGERLNAWFVDPRGRDRTFREVRRFDEPRLDLDDVAEAVDLALGN
ncbi:MAG: hypothetical protein IPG97_02950 [Microthrixaceae bacterium]|nr:hypothetical protein [Microthrixaceae bacterium]